MVECEEDVTHIGIFGSCARGVHGVGSGLDIGVILRETDVPPLDRGLRFDAARLPVPADVLAYTESGSETVDSPFSYRHRRETICIGCVSTHPGFKEDTGQTPSPVNFLPEIP